MARILVVEDDELVSRSIVRGLRDAGHEFVVASSVEQAQAVTGTFALGVFDYRLTDGLGTEVAEALLSSGQVSAVVFFTSHHLETHLGPVVLKPDWLALRATIESLLLER
ncbi:MAG: hypothetical protein R3B13_01815 [Polyangiaceae bacterium]